MREQLIYSKHGAIDIPSCDLTTEWLKSLKQQLLKKQRGDIDIKVDGGGEVTIQTQSSEPIYIDVPICTDSLKIISKGPVFFKAPLEIKKKLDIEAKRVVFYKKVKVRSTGSSHLKLDVFDCGRNSQVDIEGATVEAKTVGFRGEISLKNSVFRASEVNQYSGKMKLSRVNILAKEKLFLRKGASIDLKETLLDSSNIHLSAAGSVKKSHVEGNQISLCGDVDLRMESSVICAEKLMRFSRPFSLDHCRVISGNKVIMEGKPTITNSQVESTFFDLVADQAAVKNAVIKAYGCHLHGTGRNALQLDQSRIDTKMIGFAGHVCLQKSQVFAQSIFKHFKREEMPFDIHCLFHAIGQQVEKDFSSLRHLTVDYMKKNVDQFEEFKTEGCDEYFEQMQNGDLWGGNKEIIALSQALNRSIVVLDLQGKIHLNQAVKSSSKEPIFLLLSDENHYDVLKLHRRHKPDEVLCEFAEPQETRPKKDSGNVKIQHKLEVTSSNILVDGQVYGSQESQTKIIKQSSLSSARVFSAGEVKLIQSGIKTESFLQSKETLTIEEGALLASKQILMDQAKGKLIGAALATKHFSVSDETQIERSQIEVTESLVITEDSRVQAKDSQIEAKKTTVLGKLKQAKSQLQAGKLEIYGSVRSEDAASSIQVEEKTKVTKIGKMFLGASGFSSEDLLVDGDVGATAAIFDIRRGLMSRYDSLLDIGSSAIQASRFGLGGGLVFGDAQLKVDRFETDIFSTARGHKLILDGDEWIHRGKIETTGDISAIGKKLKNYSKIKAGKDAFFGYDRCVYNLGEMAARGMTIHSNTINLGSMRAKQSFSSAGFVDLNFGMIRGAKISQSALLSLNGGIVLPSFSKESIFSKESALQAGLIASSILIPRGGHEFLMAGKAAAGLFSLGYDICRSSGNIDLASLKDKRPYELMGMSCMVKDRVMGAIADARTVHSARKRYSKSDAKEKAAEKTEGKTEEKIEGNIEEKTAENIEENKDSQQAVKKTKKEVRIERKALLKKRVADADLTTLFSIGGLYSNSSLLRVNAGAVFSPSTSEKSLFGANLGLHASGSYSQSSFFSANLGSHVSGSYLQSSYYSANLGSICAGNATMIFDRAYNGGTIETAGSTTIFGKSMTQGRRGVLNLGDVDIHLDCFQDSGHSLFRSGQTTIKDFQRRSGGETSIKKHVLSVAKAVVEEGGGLKVEKASYSGDWLDNRGHVELMKTGMQMKEGLGNFGAVKTEDFSYRGPEIENQGAWRQSGFLDIDVTKITHGDTAIMQSEGDSAFVSIKAKQEAITGSMDLSAMSLDIEGLHDHQDFLSSSGRFKKIKTSYLEYHTGDDVTFDHQLEREGGLNLFAKSILARNGGVKCCGDLAMHTTDGDLSLHEAEFSGQSLALDIHGDLQGYDSKLYAQDTFDAAITGSMRYQGGLVQGGNHANIYTEGSILMSCIERDVQSSNGLGIVKEYHPAVILGGVGDGYDGVGLSLQSKAKVELDASYAAAVGDIFIYGRDGFETKARSNQELVSRETKRTWWGKKTTKEEWATHVQTAVIGSEKGEVRVSSDHGSIKHRGTQLFDRTGSRQEGDLGVDFSSIKTKSESSSRSSLWGVFRTKRHESHEGSVLTRINSGGPIDLIAKHGDVTGKGVDITTPDKLVTIGQNVRFSREIFDHHIREQKRSLDLSIAGQSMERIFSGKQTARGILQSADPMIPKIDALFQSGNLVEVLAGTANVGLEAFNFTSMVASGINQETLASDLLTRYQLGGAQGIDPTITATLTDQLTDIKYQTTDAGSIRAGAWVVGAQKEFSMDDGFKATVDGDMEISAETMQMGGAKLQHQVRQYQRSESVSLTASGAALSAGYGEQYSKATGDSYDHAVLDVSGHLKMDVKKATLDAANIDAGSISGHPKELEIISRGDTEETVAHTFRVSTAGDVYASKSESSSLQNKKASGIHVKGDIDETFSADKLHSVGGGISAEGHMGFVAKLATHESLVEHRTSQSFGIGGNIKEIAGAVQKPTGEQSGGKTIPTVGVEFGSAKSVSECRSTLFGQHSAAMVDEKRRVVLKDESMDISLDVPIINPEKIEQSKRDIKEACQKISDSFGQSAKAQDQVKQQKTAFQSYDESSVGKEVPSEESHVDGELSGIILGLDDHGHPVWEAENLDLTMTTVLEPQRFSAEAQTKKEKADIDLKGVGASPLSVEGVRFGKKEGGGGKKQVFDIDSGKYVNPEKELSKKAKEESGFGGVDVKAEFELYRTQGERHVWWDSDLHVGSERLLIHPAVVDDGGSAYCLAQWDLKNHQLSIDLGAERQVQVKLAEGQLSIPMVGDVKYAIDAVDVAVLCNATINTDNGFDAHAEVTAGAKVASVKAKTQEHEFCFLGISVSLEGEGSAGLGASATAGAGATLNKTKPGVELYVKAGARAACGGEVKAKVGLGIDFEGLERMDEKFREAVEQDPFKSTLEAIQESKEAVEHEQPTTIRGKAWQMWKKACLEEAEQDHLEFLGNAATIPAAAASFSHTKE